MADPSTDLRVKNKLEKQDEIEVSDEEEIGGLVNTQRRRSTKKGSPAPVRSAPKVTEKLQKQTSAPANSDRPMLTSYEPIDTDLHQMRKSSMPVAYVHLPDSGKMHVRNELTAPRHLGSMAFSSMSTEESSIGDMDILGRHMGMLSVQGSLQDEMYGSDQKKGMDNTAETADFLIDTWQRKPQDRQSLLSFEKIFEQMLHSKQEEKYLSQPLNSYYRMLFHRMADVWGFEHTPDSNKGQTAVLIKTLPDSHRPDQLFRDMGERTIPEEAPNNYYNSILKRPKNHSLPETSHIPPPRVTPISSLEDRRANYDRIRQQIFGQEDSGNDGDETPQLYGLNNQNYETGSIQAQAATAYNRSHSALSDNGSDSNYEQQQLQMRSVYGHPYGNVRPMMAVSPNLYGAPYGYAAGVMGYSGQEASYVDPAVYQQMMLTQQQQFYQGQYGQFQHPQQAMCAGMQYPQSGFPQAAYSPQGSFDQMQFDQSNQYAYQQQQQQQYNQLMGEAATNGGLAHGNHSQYGPPAPPSVESVRQHQSSPAHGYGSAGDSPHAAYRPMPNSPMQPAMHGRFSTGSMSGVSQPDSYGGGGESHTVNDAFIIPLRFPPLGNSSGQLGMFLKLPCVRAPGGPASGNDSGGEHFRRQSRHNSGRSSVDRQSSGPSPGMSPSSTAGKYTGDHAAPSVVPEFGGESGAGCGEKKQCSRN